VLRGVHHRVFVQGFRFPWAADLVRALVAPGDANAIEVHVEAFLVCLGSAPENSELTCGLL
jgi:hypothetical protein